MSETTRAWVYRITTVLLPILVVAGFVTETAAASILAAVAALLVPGLAAANTSTKGA
jgi:hypothetical protein